MAEEIHELQTTGKYGTLEEVPLKTCLWKKYKHMDTTTGTTLG